MFDPVAPWTALASDDRAAFVEAARSTGQLLAASKAERAYYQEMWGADFTEHHYAVGAGSDDQHASYAYTHGVHAGLTHEEMLAKPWRAFLVMAEVMQLDDFCTTASTDT